MLEPPPFDWRERCADPEQPAHRFTAWTIFGIVAVALIVIAVVSSTGCTEKQLSPFRKAASATTQATSQPLVQATAAATGTSGYLEVVNLAATAALAVFVLITKKKPS